MMLSQCQNPLTLAQNSYKFKTPLVPLLQLFAFHELYKHNNNIPSFKRNFHGYNQAGQLSRNAVHVTCIQEVCSLSPSRDIIFLDWSISWFSSICLCQCQDNTLKWASYHISSNM